MVIVTGVDNEPWERGGLRLFMSHLAIHQEYVGNVGRMASTAGVNSFVAHTSIQPSREWQSVIETALRTCDAMVVFLHAGFDQSPWCDQEVGFALGREIPILPLAFDLFPYGFLSKFQAEKVREQQPWDVGTRILDWLSAARLQPEARERFVEGLVTSFEQINSWDGARRTAARLETVAQFTEPQLQRLAQAAADNPEIYNAGAGRRGVTVPDVIEELVKRHAGGGAPGPTAPVTGRLIV